MEDPIVTLDTGSSNSTSSEGDIKIVDAVINESKSVAIVQNRNASNGKINEEEQFSVEKKLQYIRNQLNELSISVCKFSTCELSSLLLQIRLGEIKALKALLDVQHRDLHLLQSICHQPNAWSSSSGQSGKHKQFKKQHSIVFIGWDGDSDVRTEEVSRSAKIVDKKVRKSLEDAFKTAKTLHKHFKDAEEQYEEVLELVLVFESDVKSLDQVITKARNIISDARTLTGTPSNRRSFASDAWALYDKSLHQLNEQQSVLQLIQDSARDLLSLEPYFDGDCIRAQLSRIKTSYQQVKSDLIIRLRPLAISRLELEVVEISVVSSWLLQTDLFLQSLLRRRRINPTSTALDELSNEIGDRQSQISGVEDDLNQVLMTFPGDELPVVTELGHQVTQCHVCLSELMEKLELVRQLSEVDSTDNNNMDCLPSPLLEDDDPSVLDIAISNLPNNIEVTFDSTNRPSSLSGLDEVDSGLDDIDLSSSHYSWAHFDTETIKRKDKSKRRTIHVQLANIDIGDKRPELQQLLSQVDGLNFELLELVDRMNSTQLPPIPDIEEVHFAIDKFQVIQSETLEQHKILESLNNQCSAFLEANCDIPAKLKQSLEVYLFDVATLWQKVNLKAAEKMRQLHDREREIGEFYGQLNNLLVAIEDAKKFLEWKELTGYCDTMERVRELHHLFMSKADLKHNLLQQIDAFVASTASTVATYVTPTNAQSKIVTDLCSKKNEIQEGWLIVVEQLTVLCDERTLSTHVLRQCDKETTVIIEGAELLSSVGVDLTDVKKKHSACQQYLQQSKKIQLVLTEMSQCLCRHVTMDALTNSQAQNYQLLEQQVGHLNKVLLSLSSQLHSIETQLYTRLVLLKQFYQKWHQFKLWLNDTRQLLQSSGKSLSCRDVDKTAASNPEELTRLQTNCQLIGAKQHRVKSLQNLANEILKLSAPQEELNKFEGKVNTTLQQWDDVCSMCIPAQGANSRSLPNLISNDVSSDAPHSSYELINLIVNVQEQLRPDHMIIGQTHQLRIQLSQLRCLEYKMKVAGAILKQVKNATKQMVKRRRSSAIMAKSSEYIEGMQCDTNTDEEVQNLSTRERSRHNEKLMTIHKSSTLPGRYKTSYKLPASIVKLFALWKSTWCALCTKKKLLNALLEKWRRFETLRMSLLTFLSEANGYCNPPFEQLGTMTSLIDIDSEMNNFKHLSEDMMKFSDKLTELQKLSHRLLDVNCASTTEYLECTMRELQEQWDMFEEKFLELKPVFSALWLRWQVFYEVYKQCYHWLNEKLTRAEQFSPLAKSDMKSVKIEMEQLKELRIEIDSQENSLVTAKQKALELIAGTGGGHINQEAIQEHMEVVGKKWQRLKHLTVQRQEAVEVVLVEKQDIVEKLANSVAWLKQAEDHMDQQTTSGNDFSQVQSQYLTHKAFWQEVQEQVPKMELIIVAGKRLVDDMDWMQDEREHHVMQQITQQYLCVERRWKQLLSRGQEWGGLLDNLYPEMKQCQILCTTLGQRLTEAEVAFSCFEDIANCKSLIKLRDELSAQQAFETALNPLGELLDAITGSQRRQTLLGIKVPAEMVELAKSYHDRWDQLKAMVSSRHSRIQESITEFDTSNIMDTTLPKGWSRNLQKNGVPLFLNHNKNSMQWEHPELTATYQAIHNRYRNIKFASYRIALKLRSVQKKIQMNMLQLKNATDAFIRHDITHHNIDQTITWSDMCAVASSMFQSVEKQCSSEVVNVARSVDLLTSWAMDVFDVGHTGKVPTIAYKALVIVMTTAKLEEKYQQLFSLICNENQYADYQSLNLLLTHLVKLPASVNESDFCPPQNATNGAMECFNKADNPHFIHMDHFLLWINDEPKALVWLPVLHRLAAAEDVEHNFKCTICKVNPIKGFRYRCLQCFNYNICQECFWCRKTSKNHTLAHSVQEFCLSSRSPDNVKGVVKLLKHKVNLIKRSSFKGSERPSVSKRKRTESRGSYSIDKSSSQGSMESWSTPVTTSTPHASHHRLHVNEPGRSHDRRSGDVSRKLAISYEALERNHGREGEVDPSTKSNSLPVPQSVAYRTPSSSQHSNLLQSSSPKPVPPTNDSSAKRPEAQSADNRQTLQKRIRLLQDQNLELLNHIKVFREAIDKRQQSQ